MSSIDIKAKCSGVVFYETDTPDADCNGVKLDLHNMPDCDIVSFIDTMHEEIWDEVVKKESSQNKYSGLVRDVVNGQGWSDYEINTDGNELTIIYNPAEFS